ncbi:MAG: acyltransferase [Anaerolineales bacterium]
MPNTNQLTFTRFAAALTVVIFHYGSKIFPFHLYPLSQLIPTGQIFVSYFFTLSGFIMMLAYWPQAEKFQTLRYWVFRLARIYPVYLLGLGLTLLLNLKFLRELTALGLNLTLLQAWRPPYPNSLNYPGWSLSVEAFFYLLFPLILWVARRLSLRVSAILLFSFWGGSMAAHSYLLKNWYTGFPSFTHDVLFYNPLFHLNAFLLGALAGRWMLERGQTLQNQPRLNTALLAASLLLIALSLLYLKDFLKDAFGIRMALTNGILAPIFIVFITSLALDQTWVARLLQKPGFVLLGDASYAIYILQYPVHTFYKNYLDPRLSNFSNEAHFYTYLLLLILVSIGTFLWIENPTRQAVKRLYDRVSRKTNTRLVESVTR